MRTTSIKIVLTALAVLLLACALASCADVSAYKRAQQTNTITGYATFIATYPKSTKLIAEAQAAADKLCADGMQSEDVLQEYLSQFPSGAQADAAAVQLEKLRWEDAQTANTADAINAFLSQYPNSTYKADAEAALEELAYQTARQTDTIDAYNQFISDYPDSAHIVDANQQIDRLNAQAVIATGDYNQMEAYLNSNNAADTNYQDVLAAFEPVLYSQAIGSGDESYSSEFMSRFPQSTDAAAVQSHIYDLDWQTASSLSTIRELQSWLNSNPKNPHDSDAQSKIDALKNSDQPFQDLIANGVTPDSVAQFIQDFPGNKDAQTVQNIQSNMNGANVFALLAAGSISLDVTGNDIRDVYLTVTNKTAYPINVLFPVGTWFASGDSSQQSMLLTDVNASLYVDGNDSSSHYFNTACMNVLADIPYNDNPFTIQQGTNALLTKLVQVMNDNDVTSYTVMQAAVWLAIGQVSNYDVQDHLYYSDGTQAISDDDLTLANQMLAQARQS